MIKAEVTAMLLVIKNAYQRCYEKQTEESVKQEESLWVKMMEDLDGAIVRSVIYAWIAKEKWPPTIADIRELVYYASNPEIKSAEEAWELVIAKKWDDSVQQWNFYRWSELCESGKRALTTIGKGSVYHALMYDTTQLGYLRKQFIDQFNAVSSTEKEKGVVPAFIASAQTQALVSRTSKLLSSSINTPEKER